MLDRFLAGAGAPAAARVLLLEDGDDAYVFAHDVIREVEEAGLSAARRALLHRRAAEALDDGSTGAAPEALAYHYARGGVPEKAVLHLEAAGDRAWAALPAELGDEATAHRRWRAWQAAGLWERIAAIVGTTPAAPAAPTAAPRRRPAGRRD